jgi:hypothetical protein
MRFDQQVSNLLNQLNLVKDKFIKQAQELEISTRNDVVAVTLKDLIKNSKDYDDLKNKLNNYIDSLLQNKKEDDK